MQVRKKPGWIRARFEDGIYTFFFCGVHGSKEQIWTLRTKKGRKVSDRHKEFSKSCRKQGLKATKWINNVSNGEYFVYNWIMDHLDHLKIEGEFLYLIK